MKQLVLESTLALALCGLASGSSAARKSGLPATRSDGSAAGKQGPPTAKEVAASYFEALTGGDAAKANELSTVPFSFDRKEVLTKKEQVEARHKAIAAKKGKRKVPEYTVAVSKDAPKLDRKVFPAYVAYRITIAGDDEHIDIYVKAGKSPKVIGFSD